MRIFRKENVKLPWPSRYVSLCPFLIKGYIALSVVRYRWLGSEGRQWFPSKLFCTRQRKLYIHIAAMHLQWSFLSGLHQAIVNINKYIIAINLYTASRHL